MSNKFITLIYREANMKKACALYVDASCILSFTTDANNSEDTIVSVVEGTSVERYTILMQASDICTMINNHTAEAGKFVALPSTSDTTVYIRHDAIISIQECDMSHKRCRVRVSYKSATTGCYGAAPPDYHMQAYSETVYALVNELQS